jgi:signal transduction histidine kinase
MAIPIVLIWFTWRRRDLPYRWIFWLFGAFIIGCGFTHFMEVVVSHIPLYRLSGLMKILTAIISWVTVIALVPLIPKVLALRSPRELEEEIAERKRTEVKLEQMHKQLLETSRQAGMSEIATNVLHNVGNVLNSVNVSTTLVAQSVKESKVSSLSRVITLLQQHEHDLGTFITTDPKGKQLPLYLAQLTEHLQSEQEAALKELELLRGNIDHIKEIVAMQQSYAKVGGVKENIQIIDLVEDSLRMNAGALNRHEIEVTREYADIQPIHVEKHKILQILVNLIRNAKYACDESGRTDKRMTLRVKSEKEGISISVIDNGVGIAPENRTRIFQHGFTTRKEGHGFGLHSGSLAAKEMGGSLTMHSDGINQGATFTLELPTEPRESMHE